MEIRSRVILRLNVRLRSSAPSSLLPIRDSIDAVAALSLPPSARNKSPCAFDAAKVERFVTKLAKVVILGLEFS